MDESKDEMSPGHGKKLLNPFALKKPKKRSLVERELETNMTARMTSPAIIGDSANTSRYGRARRKKYQNDGKNISTETLKSPVSENTPVKVKTPISKPVVSSPHNRRKVETPNKVLDTTLDNIDNIYQENKSLSRFNTADVMSKNPPSAKKNYIRKDLIQNREADDDIILIKDLFSPKSGKKNKALEISIEKSKSSTKKKNNGYIDNSSVVKALDFDGDKKDFEGIKRDSDGNIKKKDNKIKSNSDKITKAEATSEYQVGDLAWARMGTFPFWPCIITRDPANEMFVRKKLFGRVEHDILHVTFFADNGRRSWVVDNMLRKYMGPEEFVSTREAFTTEDKKKDPRLCAAFFISEKKISLWNTSVDEAEMIHRESKAARIDIFNESLHKARASKKLQKSGKITRTDSDVSLSESLYDSLFSEDDSKTEDSNSVRNRSKNRSLDVSDVVTACLDNMAAKTGNSKIKRQSHMDRWLQKAKSKTPEKVKTNIEESPKTPVAANIETVTSIDNNTPKVEKVVTPKTDKDEKVASNNKKKKLPPKEVKIIKVYSLRRSYESQNALIAQSKNEEQNLKDVENNKDETNQISNESSESINTADCDGIIPKDEKKYRSKKKVTCRSSKEKFNDKFESKNNTIKDENNDDDVLNAINELLEDTSTTNVKAQSQNNNVESTKQIVEKHKRAKLRAKNKQISKDMKPEGMDTDESHMNNLQDKYKHSEGTENQVLESPVKTEIKDSVENNQVSCSRSDKIDCEGPVKIENEVQLNQIEIKKNSPIETNLVNSNSKAVQGHKLQNVNEVTSEIKNISGNTHQMSPTLKCNEMVSISDNSNTTDDESSSMTPLDENIIKMIDLEDHNSNLTNMNKISKIDICNLTEKGTNESTVDINICEKQSISVDVHDMSIEKPDNSIENVDVFSDKNDNISIDEDVTMSEKVDFHKEESKTVEESESILGPCKNKELINSIEMKLDEATPSKSHAPNPFLDDSRNIDCVDSTNVSKDIFFREVEANKPPDLTSDSLAAKHDLLLNVQNNDSDFDEDSDDEPSPEFEPLGEEITEDFRQHMKCIEDSITDKKDEAQLVKVVNKIALLEESKLKLADIKSSISKTISYQSILLDDDKRAIKEEIIKTEQGLVKVEAETNGYTKEQIMLNKIYLTNTDISKELKTELIDGLEIINKSEENKKKHRLSLKKVKPALGVDGKESIAINDNTVNPMYKTIDQIEEIIKKKLKKLPIGNEEVHLPEIKANGYKIEVPDIKDDDFDIENASVSSEDSEVSLPHDTVPARRSLRSRPEKKGGLEDPEFLTYLELRQDDLMEQHPELTRDDIVLYLYKTYTYSQNLSSDTKIEESPIKKTIKQEDTPSRKKIKKSQLQPKNTLENYFREKYKNVKKTDFEEMSNSIEDITVKRELLLSSPVDSGIGNSKDSDECVIPVTKKKTKSNSPIVDLTVDITEKVKVELNDVIDVDINSKTPRRLRKKTISPRVLGSDLNIASKSSDKSFKRRVPVVVISPIKNERTEIKIKPDTDMNYENVTDTKHHHSTIKHEIVVEPKVERDTETESIDSDSEIPLRQLRSKVNQEKLSEVKTEISELKEEIAETSSVDSDVPLLKLKPKRDKSIEGSYEDPVFLKYLELKRDAIIDENPQLSNNEIIAYLYKTWIYEKNSKSDIQKNDDIESSNLVKGLKQETTPQRKVKRKIKTEKNVDSDEIILKDKPKRKTVSRYYNEAFLSDIEDELEVFEIFKTKKTPLTVVSKQDSPKKENTGFEVALKIEDDCEEINTLDEIELYFKQLTSPKPSVFKGLIREKVCGICEDISNLIKCKGCNRSFHYDCVFKATKVPDTPVTSKVRKRKKKPGRKSKNPDDSENSDERPDVSEEIPDEEPESLIIDAATLEAELEAKMREIMENETHLNYDSYSSDDGIDWTESVPGKCELVDVKLKRRRPQVDYSNFKCNNCQEYDTPICFVCKSAVSKTNVKVRQKCNVTHCHTYYHIECLDHWPQTQFNAGELTRWSKKASEKFEALTCPRHVCHTCVSDDPRGCKTRFSGDKLAKCVRCPATYHSFNKCLPAGTQILTASLIICPRHYEHRPGKVPCHVNTGWCFICALGGSLICCEYCPTSFHAECLNIKPPEGNYMCEDCETGRLPLYGEMVWVKLGHYRWWPGVILHPSEIPENIMAVKHGLGEFVVRFFGQYDHYWVNRGRVFPYQEGDSGRISSQKSKIDAAFTTAMEHAQRAFEILKNAQPDEEESLDIASSLLPPHYVKLKCNKPIGSLLGRKIEDPSLSLTQCECNPIEIEPCGSNSQCLNRVLLTECGPTCRAGERCNNRAFEKRLYPKLTAYKAPNRGWGLKTLEDIKAGQFVIEYVGELIDVEEFQRRMRRKHEIRDENFYFLTLDKERMIDAGPKGNLARFMNHCCEPNCETQKWTVLGDIRVGLFAIDDIKANSEVTFNYNLECTGIEKKRCLCGAKRCSGYIGAKPKQLEETNRKRNSVTGKRKYTKRKNIEESSATSKSKAKRPPGRPPKPKELTDIEKDLLIIQSATENPSTSPNLDDIQEDMDRSKEIKPLRDSIGEVTLLNGSIDTKIYNKGNKSDYIPTGERILNGIVPSKMLKRKLDYNSSVEMSCEPSTKKLKYDRQSEVGD